MKKNDLEDTKITKESKIETEKLDNEAQIEAKQEQSLDIELTQTINFQQEKIAKLEKEKKQIEEKALRHTAEALNKQKRNEQELEKYKKYSLSNIINELLPVIDNLERTLNVKNIQQEIKIGIEMTLKEFISVLKKNGVIVISPEKNQAFNAEKHHAISQIEVKDQKENSIVEVVQTGYEINGRLLRAAMVVVAK